MATMQVNVSQTLAAASNVTAIIVASLPFFLPEDMIPSWVKGPVVMFVTTAGTAVMAVTAALDPIFNFLVFRVCLVLGCRFARALAAGASMCRCVQYVSVDMAD